ncbi:GNAT family N-acetyltransferase [Yoonia sp. SS1-5]|uniref:N-acetyltransferase family protein n=1 Tax=Yoonia rhodophyticola TaxID=3137370 RepID=A0AAN0MA54_9RHOB
MDNVLTIRWAVPDDAEALLALYQHLSSDMAVCPPALARRNLEEIAAYKGSGVLLGQIGGTCVASCTLIIVPNLTRGGAPYALVENVVTHAEHRLRGYGKHILDAASDRAWGCGCYKIMLSTGSTRPSVLGFYESAGFEQSRTGFQKRRMPARSD